MQNSVLADKVDNAAKSNNVVALKIPETAKHTIAVETVHIGKAPIASISKQDLMLYITAQIDTKEHNYICFCDSNLCVRATYEKEIRQFLDDALLVLPDGVAMTAGARLLGKPLPGRLPGPTIMLEVCKNGIDKGIHHFFYGGAQGVAEKLAKNLAKQFEGLQIVGTYCPPFRPLTNEEDEQVTKMINDARPDIVWVGLGAPKQEKWMHSHLGRLNAPLMMGVGAAFDFHSGNRKWAPAWIRKCGCEWIYRMFTGGKRVFWRNLKCVSMFVYLIFKQKIISFFNKDNSQKKSEQKL